MLNWADAKRLLRISRQSWRARGLDSANEVVSKKSLGIYSEQNFREHFIPKIYILKFIDLLRSSFDVLYKFLNEITLSVNVRNGR